MTDSFEMKSLHSAVVIIVWDGTPTENYCNDYDVFFFCYQSLTHFDVQISETAVCLSVIFLIKHYLTSVCVLIIKHATIKFNHTENSSESFLSSSGHGRRALLQGCLKILPA